MAGFSARSSRSIRHLPAGAAPVRLAPAQPVIDALYAAARALGSRQSSEAAAALPANLFPQGGAATLTRLAALPGLKNHGCSYGKPGGFVRRLTEGEGGAIGIETLWKAPVLRQTETFGPLFMRRRSLQLEMQKAWAREHPLAHASLLEEATCWTEAKVFEQFVYQTI